MKLLLVITSFSILQSLTEPLGTPDMEIKTIVKSGLDPHDYKLTAQDAATLKNADAFVFLGLGLDPQIEKLARRLNSKALFCSASDNLSLIQKDPHVWQSPTRAALMASTIAECLNKLSPSTSSQREEKKKDYVTKILKLRDDYKKTFSSLPTEKKRILTAHNAFAYLGEEFSLQISAVQGLSTDMEPTPKTVARLIQKVKSDNIKALFLEKNLPPHALKRVALETKVKIGGELFSDSLSAEPEPAGTYLKMMEYNLKTISETLKSEAHRE